MINCRHFNGYRPCQKNQSCSSSCQHFDLVNESIAIIHLGAIGAVVRSTALLSKIRKKHPQSHITWITDSPCDQLLYGHPLIDKVVTTKQEELVSLLAQNWDFAYVIDKSKKATGIANFLRSRKILGFQSHPVHGGILAATPAANELWHLGLNDELKFKHNQKSELELICQSLELPGEDLPDYNLPLTEFENQTAHERARAWRTIESQPIIGINTGCSSTIPYKRLSLDSHSRLIDAIFNTGLRNIVLLGGKEDSERNQTLETWHKLINSPSQGGLRDGLLSVAACDIVLTGDSLGMHLAISQQKFVIAWFGPTCSQEIELFGRGEKIHSQASCGPCWKRLCEKPIMCYDQVTEQDWLQALARGTIWWQKKFLSSKQLSLGTSSSVFR